MSTYHEHIHFENQIEGSMIMANLEAEIFSKRTQLFHCFPGGNDTFVVINSDIERSNYTRVDALIKEKYPQFEQGAMLEPATNRDAVLRMQMAGGEFCGNATRSVAALIAQSLEFGSKEISVANYRNVETIDGQLHFLVEVSGTNELVDATVIKDTDGWQVLIELPTMRGIRVLNELSITLNEKKVNCSLVELEGIAHIIIPSEDLPFVNCPALFETMVADVLSQTELGKYPAFGLIWCSLVGEEKKIDPVVYVASLKSYIYESACGSGTIALGLRDTPELTSSTVLVKQPSGATLQALIDRTGENTGVIRAELSGPVTVLGDLNCVNGIR